MICRELGNSIYVGDADLEVEHLKCIAYEQIVVLGDCYSCMLLHFENPVTSLLVNLLAEIAIDLYYRSHKKKLLQ